MIHEKFPDVGFLEEGKGNHIFTIPPKVEDFGKIEIYDDGDEVTIYLGRFTHGHFSNYVDGLAVQEKEKEIAEDVIDFLEALFDDRVVAWGSHNSMGGWKRFEGNRPQELRFRETFTWSGKIE